MADEIFLKNQIRKILIQENKKLKFKTDSEIARDLNLNTNFEGKNPAEIASNAFKKAISELQRAYIEPDEAFDRPEHKEEHDSYVTQVIIGSLNPQEAKFYADKILKAAALTNNKLNGYRINVIGDFLLITFEK